MSGRKKEAKKRLKLELKLSVGTIVWGKLGSYHWWPGTIIKPEDCHQPEPKFGNVWIFWFGDHKISQVSRKKIVEFTSHFHQMFRGISGKTLQKAVLEALEVLARNCNYDFSENQDLISWAKAGFNNTDKPLVTRTADVPSFVSKYLVHLRNSSQSSESDDMVSDSESADQINTNIPLIKVREGSLKIEEICIGCYESEVEVVDGHPLFDGGICYPCKERIQENFFVYGNDGKSICCNVCFLPGSLILCENKDCHRSFCINCITLLLGPNEKKKIVETNPWYCFFCTYNDGYGLLRIKKDWESRTGILFQPAKLPVEELLLDFTTKKPIKVLSLFDGIGTGKFVLDSLGFEIEAYYASEIDEDAINVAKFHNKDSITYIGDVTQLTEEKIRLLGPIDLVIGGSPCNDLSLVNPLRKGIYDNTGTGHLFFDYFHILSIIRKLNHQNHVFFLYENVAAMSQENKRIISTFLMHDPTLWDSKFVSPQIRPRYFWGNIPGMHMYHEYRCSLQNDVKPDNGYQEENLLDNFLIKNLGRKAVVQKIRTVTTQKNSLLQDNYALLPVNMKGVPDVLWITELERVFGFPMHYTDIGCLNINKRQELLGRAWSVPVIKNLFLPLKRFFKCNVNSIFHIN